MNSWRLQSLGSQLSELPLLQVARMVLSGGSLLTPVGGIGVTVNFTKELSARAELETRKVKLAGSKETVTNFSVGMQYSF
jgi:hypothetical protein